MAVQIDEQRPQTQLGMDQNRRLEIHFIEGLIQIRQNHNGKLQALGLVDGHDGHTAAAATCCRLGLLTVFQQKAQMTDEGEEALMACSLKAASVFKECDEILPPALATRHGAENTQNVQLIIEMPQQPMDTHVLAHNTQLGDGVQKVLAVGIFAGRQRVIKVPLGVASPDHRQPIRRKTEDRRAQHRNQRHILPGIIQDLQQRIGNCHLHGRKEILILLHPAGDGLLGKGPGIVAQPGPRGAHQHRDILRAAGPQGISVRICHRVSLIQQLPDPLRHEAGLRQGTADTLSAANHGRIQQMELHRAVLPLRKIACAEIQLLDLGIGQFAHLAAHHGPEHKVHRIQHRLAGSEILTEEDLSRLPLPFLTGQHEAAVFFQKDGGIGQSEAVDGLFDIAHGEEIFLLPGNGGENTVLHLIGVLILVHHHLQVAPRHRAGQLRGLTVTIQQQTDGIVLLIGEIRGVAPQLLPAVGCGKPAAEIQQSLHSRGRAAQILRHSGRGILQHRAGIVHLLLAAVPDALHPGLQLRIFAFADCRQFGPHGDLLRRGIPSLRQSCSQSRQQLTSHIECTGITLVNGLILFHLDEASLQHLLPVGRLSLQGSQNLPAAVRPGNILR